MDKKVNALSRDIDKLSRKRINIDFDINAMDDIAKTEAMINELDGKKIKIDMEIDNLDKLKTDAFNDIDRGASKAHKSVGMGGIGGGGLIASIAMLATTLGPAAVVATGWAGAMVSSFAVAGAAAGAFGVLAIPTFNEVKKGLDAVTTAQENIVKAGTDVKKLAEAHKEMAAALRSMPPDIAKVVSQWQNLVVSYKAAAAVLRTDTLGIFSSGIQFLNTMLQKAIPVAVNAAKGIKTLMDQINAGIKGESWTRFFDYLTMNAEGFIVTWGKAIGNLLTGLANIVVGFDPLAQKFNGGFLEMTERFRVWSEDLGNNKGFQTFIREVLDKTPQVWAAIKGIATVGWDLIKVLYQIGSAILPVIKPALDMVHAFMEAHPEIAKVVTIIGALFIALSPLSGALTFIGGAIAALGLGPFAVVLGAVALAFAVVASSGGKMGDTMKALKEIWATLKEQALGLWQNLQPLINQFKQNIAPQFLAGFNSLLRAIQSLLPIIKPVATFLAVAFIANLQATGVAFRVLAKVIEVAAAIIGGVIRAMAAVFQWIYNLLVGHSILPELDAAFRKYLTAWIGPVKAAWNGFKSFVSGLWSGVKSLTTSAANAVGNTIRTVFSRLPGWVRGPINNVLSIIRGLPGQIKGALGSLGGLLVSAGRNLISGLISGISGMIGSLKSKLGSVTSMIPSWKGPPATDYKLLQNNGKLVMAGFIDKVDSMRGQLRATLMSVTKDISTYGQGSLNSSMSVNGSAGSSSAGMGQSIGVYVAKGAIQVNGGSSAQAEELLSKLTRISRFGQFQGPAKAGAL